MFGAAKAVSSSLQGRLPAGSARILRRTGGKRQYHPVSSDSRALHCRSLQKPLSSAPRTSHQRQHQQPQRRSRSTTTTTCIAGREGDSSSNSNNSVNKGGGAVTAILAGESPAADPAATARLHSTFLEYIEQAQASEAVEHFAAIMRAGGPLVTLRRRQLLVMLCAQGLVEQASQQLTGATVCDYFDSQDLATVAGFMYVIEACLHHGELDRALKHFRQASGAMITLDLPLCEGLALALFVKGLEQDDANLRTWGWNVLEYVKQSGMKHGSEVCDAALIQAARKTNIAFAHEMCEYMETRGLFPSREAVSKLYQALDEGTPGSTAPATTADGAKAAAADRQAAESIGAYLDSWTDESFGDLDEDGYHFFDHVGDADEDYDDKDDDDDDRGGGVGGSGGDDAFSNAAAARDDLGDVDRDVDDENGGSGSHEMQHDVKVEASQAQRVPREEASALQQQRDLADYSDGEGSDPWLLDEDELAPSGLPASSPSLLSSSSPLSSPPSRPKTPTAMEHASAVPPLPPCAVAAAATAGADARKRTQNMRLTVQKHDDGQATVIDAAAATGSSLSQKGQHHQARDRTRGQKQQPNPLEIEKTPRGRSGGAPSAVAAIEWGGPSFVGDLAAQLSWLHPKKPPMAFRGRLRYDDDDFDDDYNNFYHVGGSNGRLGDVSDTYDGWGPHGMGWGGVESCHRGAAGQGLDHGRPTIVDVDLAVGEDEDGQAETVPVRVIIRSEHDVTVKNLLMEVVDEDEDDEDE